MLNVTWLYVGVLYAVAVWIARRWSAAACRRLSQGAGKPAHSEGFPWRVAALFYALVLIFLWRPMTQDYVNVPVDYLSRLPPWALVARGTTVNAEINDIPMQMIPWAHEVREQWKSLQFPLWNPTTASGSVLLANGQSAALSPLRMLALPLPLGDSFTAEAAMKMLIALTFTFLFCRRRGYSEVASATGAAAFGFSMFVIVWLHFPHATVAAYLPAVLLQIDLLAEKVTLGRFSFFAATWAVALFGGHPETALHIFVLAALMVMWIVAIERPFATWLGAGRFLGVLAGAMTVGALLAAPFFAPLIEALPKSLRYHLLQAHPSGIGFTDFQSSILLVQPGFFGVAPVDRSWGPAVAESICGFAGILGFAGWIALLLDAATTRRWRTREVFFVIATPLILAIILDWPLIGTAFNGLFSVAANARVRLLLCFVMAMQAAAAVDLAQRDRRRPLLIGIAVVASSLLVLMWTTDFPGAWARNNTILSMLPTLLVLALAVAIAMARRRRGLAAMLLLGAVVVELWSAGRAWNPVVPTESMYPETPLIRQLQTLRNSAPPNAPFRIVGLGPMLFPNTGALFGFEDIRSHDPMANGRYLGVLRALTGYDSEAYFAHWNNTKTRFLDFLNVKYLVAGPGVEMEDGERFPRVYDGNDGRIFQNLDALPRFFAARNVVLEFKEDLFVRRLINESDWAHTGVVKMLPVESDRMRQDLLAPRPPSTPDARVSMIEANGTSFRMRVHAPRYTLIVSSQPFWPGWQIRRNGRSVDPLTVNGAFLGFTIPPGDWDIHVFYFPASFYLGLAASLTTIAILIALSIRSRRTRTESPARSE